MEQFNELTNYLVIIAQLNVSLWETVNGPYHRAYAQWTCLCPSTTLTFSHSSIPDSIDTRYIKLDGWDRRKALTICSQFPFVMYLSRLQCHSERCHSKANLECSCSNVMTLLDRMLVHRNYHPNNVGTNLQLNTRRQTGVNEIAQASTANHAQCEDRSHYPRSLSPNPIYI